MTHLVIRCAHHWTLGYGGKAHFFQILTTLLSTHIGIYGFQNKFAYKQVRRTCCMELLVNQEVMWKKVLACRIQ